MEEMKMERVSDAYRMDWVEKRSAIVHFATPVTPEEAKEYFNSGQFGVVIGFSEMKREMQDLNVEH